MKETKEGILFNEGEVKQIVDYYNLSQKYVEDVGVFINEMKKRVDNLGELRKITLDIQQLDFIKVPKPFCPKLKKILDGNPNVKSRRGN